MTETETNQVPEPAPKLFVVSTVTGEIWQLGRPVPGSEYTKSIGKDGQEVVGSEGKEMLVIRSMFENEDRSIEVFALPVPGSEFDKQKTGAVFTLYPLTIQRTLTVARFDVWKDMLEEAELAELGEPDPGDPEPEESATATPSLVAAPSNGSAAAGTSATSTTSTGAS